jgi:hypothetical protein
VARNGGHEANPAILMKMYCEDKNKIEKATVQINHLKKEKHKNYLKIHSINCQYSI